VIKNVFLKNSGAIYFYNKDNILCELNPIYILPSLKKWQELHYALDSLFSTQDNLNIKTIPENCIVNIDDNCLKCNNLMGSDTDNLFILTKKTILDAKEENFYELHFDLKTFSNIKCHINVNTSIYVYYYDKDNNFISREKSQVLLTPNDEYEHKKIDFIPPPNTHFIALGIFLNKLWKIDNIFKNFVVYEYFSKKQLPSFSNWTYTDKYNAKWESKIDNILITIEINYCKEHDIFDLNYKIESKEDTPILQLGTSINSDVLIDKILYRDLSWKFMPKGKVVIDRLSPKYLQFNNGFSIVGALGFDSLEYNNFSYQSSSKFYMLNQLDRPNFYFSNTRDKIYSKEYVFEKDEVFTANIQVKCSSADKPIFSGRAPSSREAIFILTHHADATVNESLQAILFGASNINHPIYLKQGLIPNKLTATWSVFNKSIKNSDSTVQSVSPYIVEGMESKRYFDTMKKSKDIEWVLHTATNYDDDREAMQEAINKISEFNARNWIDHSLASGKSSSGLKSFGWDKESKYYIMDLLEEKKYLGTWAYIDTDTDRLNQLYPSKYDLHTPILYQHSSLKYDKHNLWQWTSFRFPTKKFYEHVSEESLYQLITERGVGILHEYFAHLKAQNNYFFHILKDGTFIIDERLNKIFEIISMLINKNLLWNPTVSIFTDYILSLDKVKIYSHGNNILIENKANPIKNYTLWIHKDLKKNNFRFKGEIIQPLVDYNGEYLKYQFDLPSGKNQIIYA